MHCIEHFLRVKVNKQNIYDIAITQVVLLPTCAISSVIIISKHI